MRSDVWERHSGQVVETLRRAMQDANISIDELSALSGIDRAEIRSVLDHGTSVAPNTSARLAVTLSDQIADRAHAKPVNKTSGQGEEFNDAGARLRDDDDL
jgi:hypothetical protein